MGKRILNLGATENDGSGDSLRSGGAKINANFDDLYALADVWDGTGGTAALNTAIDDAQSAKTPLRIPAGYHVLSDADLNLFPKPGNVGIAQGFALQGAAMVGNYDIKFIPFANITYGTLLDLRGVRVEGAGRRFTPGQGRARRFENISIYTSFNGTMIDGENILENGGGGERFMLINDIRSSAAATNNPAIIKSGAFFESDIDYMTLMGRIDYSQSYNDNTIAAEDLYFTDGFVIDGSGKGSGSGPRNVNTRGCKTGCVIGVDRALYDSAPNGYALQNQTFHNIQHQYGHTGAIIQAGTKFLEYNQFHLEFLFHIGIHVRGGDAVGPVVMRKGRTTATGRIEPGGQRFMRGLYVLGDNDGVNGGWSEFRIHDTDIAFTQNCGIFLHVSPSDSGTKRVIVDCCTGDPQGNRPLIAIDHTHLTNDTVPQIWIKNWRHKPGDLFPADRFIRCVEPNYDGGLHVASPATGTVRGDGGMWGRIEEPTAPTVLPYDHSFRNMNYPPSWLSIATNRSLELSAESLPGFTTRIDIAASRTLTLTTANGAAILGDTSISGPTTALLTTHPGGVWEVRAL